jgi:hypothetical protein
MDAGKRADTGSGAYFVLQIWDLIIGSEAAGVYAGLDNCVVYKKGVGLT